jgi:Zn-finger nucleic acid-binding protein
VPALLTFKLIGGNDMQCPNCVNETLVTTQRRDIEIDHCPNCGGVWLDKGELEKVITLASDEGRSAWDERERGGGYGRSRRRASDNDDEEQYEGREQRGERRYEDDDDDNGGYEDEGRSRGDGYQGREREPYGREGESRERPSIWREIFENLEKLPLPRV